MFDTTKLFSLVFVTSIYAPLSLAFTSSYSLSLELIDLIINVIFFIDVFVTFCSAYQDNDLQIIEDRKVMSFLTLSLVLGHRCSLFKVMVPCRHRLYYTFRLVHQAEIKVLWSK